MTGPRPARARRTGRSATTLLVSLALAAALGAVSRPAGAQEVPGVTRRAEGVQLDFQDAELRVVLSAVADAAGLSAVLADIPSRAVTLRTPRPIPPAEVRRYLETLVQSNGLTLTEEGGLVRITGAAPGEGAPGGPARQREPVRLFVHRLQHADAAGLAQTLSTVFGLGGDAREAGARPAMGSLSEELAGLRTGQLDPASVGRGLPPGAADPAGPRAGGGEPVIGGGLTAAVQIVPDARTNSLLVRANAADYATIRAAVAQLDVRPVQVLIEVLIAEVRHDRQRGLGVSTRVPPQRVGSGPATVGGELAGASTGDLVIRALQVGGVRADVVLSALAADANISILSRPLIVARNNEEARILVGSERPFVQLFRSLPTDAAVRDQVIQYRNVGTQLTIRPTINPDGYVSLSVLQEVSSATAETQFGAPVISTREARTELLVLDGRTAVIGGLVDQQRERSQSGVPLLKDIPGLGWIFRSTQQRRVTTELFLFLTPHVLRTDDQLEEATRQLRDRNEALRRSMGGRVPIVVPRDPAPRDSVPR